MRDGTPFLCVAADRIGAPGSARIAGKNAIPRHQRRQLVLDHPDRREDGRHSKANCTSRGFQPHSTGWEGSIWGIPVKWTRLSCRKFRHNAVRLQLHALAYNLGNFMRTLVLPDAVEQWSLTTLREKLVKIGAKIVRHGRYIVFQMAEVAIPRDLFADILRRIDRLRTTPLPT